MHLKTTRRISLLLICFAICIHTSLSSQACNGHEKIESKPNCCYKMGSKDRIPVRKLPSEPLRSSSTCSNVSNFVAVYDTDMPSSAQNAFNYALDIFEDVFISPVDININVTWEDIPGNAIGYAGAYVWRSNLSFLPESNKWYPEPLVNLYRGYQYNSNQDINVWLDSSTNWYYGTDGNPAWNQVDMVTVILHEICHGLGFTGTANSDGTPVNTTIGWSGDPNIYDEFVENGAGTSILSYSNGSSALLSQLVNNNLYFNGPFVNVQNSGTPAKIKASNPFIYGVNFGHLDDSYSNEIMRSFIVTGDAIHTLDDVSLAVMRDLGWNVCSNNCPTELSFANNNELNGTQSYKIAYESDGIIESVQNLNVNTDIFYDSGTSIELLSGFEVGSGVNFEAFINGCGDN